MKILQCQFAVTLLLATLAAVSSTQLNFSFPNEPEYFNEEAAQYLIKQANDVYWASATAYRQFADDTLSPEILMREKLRPFYGTMQKFDWRSFDDPQLKRQFEVILRGAKYPSISYKFKKATSTLKNMSRKKWVCNMKEPKKCNMAFVHQIKTVFTNSDDLDEIKYYWKEWRNKMPADVKEALHYYIDYYRNLSTPDLPASAFWYDQYEDRNLIYELESLMESLRPFYREMHAHLRNVLRHKYGDDVIPPTGLIPHHLLEQVTYQAWKKETVLQNPFPQRKLPNLQSELDSLDLQPFDLVNISVQFFSSLGFRNLTDEFMQDHFIQMSTGTGGPDCKSRIFDFGEVELHYCPKVYYKKLLQTHADIALVQYATEKNNFRVGLNQEACPGFGAALGEAVILSVSTPKHLKQTLGILQNYDYDDILNLNRLYRLAAHTLLTLPTYYVHEKLWVEMIDGKIQPEHYNCRYWNLMQKYMGVEPPLLTNPGTYDMPYKFYEGIIDQFRSTKKLFDEFLGYQIYRAICLNIGEFERRNAYKPLDNCDFYGSKHAGKFIYDMMTAASSKPWREIIKPLTSIHMTNMTATAFLEYFEPLNTWISEDNVSKNLHVGWMSIDMLFFISCFLNRRFWNHFSSFLNKMSWRHSRQDLLPYVICHYFIVLLTFLCLLNCATKAFALTNTTTQQTKYPHAAIYEAHAIEYLNKSSTLMQSIWTRRRNSFFSLTTKGRGYNVVNQAPIKQEIENDYRHLVRELAINLSTIPVMQLQDPILRRRVKRLAKLQLNGLSDEDYEEAKNLLHTMQTFITTRMVCSLGDCQQTLSMVPSILNHVVRTKNLADLEYFWREWRSVLADRDRAKSAFISYVRLLRLAAYYNGHITPSRTWYLYYDTDNFQRELEDVVWEIMPLYQELHAYLLKCVRSTYGEKLNANEGAIPAHVLEQIIRQAWSSRTVFRTPYPKNQLPTVKQRLEEILVTTVKIIKKSAEFFESLGLNHMSDSFYDRFSRRIGDEELGPDCRAEVFYFPPDAALRYCPKLDYKKLMQIHGNMAELQYNIYRGRLPFGVDSEPCPGFASGIGEAAVIASGTPRHLNQLHILFNHSLNEEQSMNRLFRMGIHTILAIPQYFVNDKFLVDVMDGHIGAQDLNCGYWNLQNKYAGIVPPMRRNEKTFDPDFKFYRGLNPEKPNTVKLLSEILGYQFYRAFCLASEQYRPGDPEYPLHNCDFYGSTKAGDLMKQMMEAGATKHWRDLMEIATGERKLSGKGVMEYFAPLYTWLKEENKKNSVEPGWESETRCSKDYYTPS